MNKHLGKAAKGKLPVTSAVFSALNTIQEEIDDEQAVVGEESSDSQD